MPPRKPPLTIAANAEPTRGEALAEVTDPEVRSRLERADILLLPRVAAEPPKGAAFASQTREMFRFLKAKLPPATTAEVVTETDEIALVVLHGELYDLGVFLMSQIAAPVLLSMLANYLSEKLRNSRARRHSTVRCRMLLERRDGSCSALDYEGPADTFEELMRAGLAKGTEGEGS
jgi:hypothetical protein